MFPPRKPHPFGNEYHKIACDKSKVIYNVGIVEGKDQPIVMGKKGFEEKGETTGFMVRKKIPYGGQGMWRSWKEASMYWRD